MAQKRVQGGCLCGAVRYEAGDPSIDSCYCHCDMCKRWTGAPVVSAVGFRTAAIGITRGQPKYFQSSTSVDRGFCADCGSSLFVRYPNQDEFWVMAGTLDNPGSVAPRRHICIESQLPGFEIADGLPRIPSEEEPGTPSYDEAVKQGEA